ERANGMTAVAGGRARLLIDGQWQAGTDAPLEVTDKYTRAPPRTRESPGREQVDAAVAAARRSFTASPLDPQDRYLRLQTAASLVERHRDEFAPLFTAQG